MTNDPDRPDPDVLLEGIKHEEEQKKRGRLKIFLGMCAGVGKTYSMLQSAQELLRRGSSLVVGLVETHGRAETEALLKGLRVLPRMKIAYRGREFEDLDINAVLAERPQLVLVDELAHSNVPGMRHEKRYQDVLELLDNGISVHTTLNVQHLESLKDTVRQITDITVHEAVPDSIVDRADEIELVDISPQDLLARLSEGKVYLEEKARAALTNFFSTSNLIALRELALRIAAQRVADQLTGAMRRDGVEGPWKAGERLMVAVGPSPYSEQLIRWTRRIASTMNAPWIAVYVQRSGRSSETIDPLLKKNISLAQELGAELVTTTDDDVARALLRIARQRNVTQIVIGKSMSRPVFDLFHGGSLVNRLIHDSGGIDIYVVQSDKAIQPFHRKDVPAVFPFSGLQQYLLSTGIITAVTLVCLFSNRYIDYRSVGMVLLFAVLVLAIFVKRGAVLLSAALGAFLWDFLFIPPQFTLTVSSLTDTLMLLMYFFIAITGGSLTSRIRRHELTIQSRERDTAFLYSYSRLLAGAAAIDEMVRITAAEVRKHFASDIVVFLAAESGRLADRVHRESSLQSISPKESAVAQWVYQNKKPAGRGTRTLSLSEFAWYPLLGAGRIAGVAGLSKSTTKSQTQEQESLLLMLLQQFALSVERENYRADAEKAHILARSENLYKTLLGSVSHQLRTPLVTIKGAATGLLDNATGADECKRITLASDISDSADRLDRLVRNLLDMTRIESGLLKPRIDWCNIRECVDVIVNEVHSLIGAHELVFDFKGDLPLVRADEVLLKQAILNIVLNALIHTPVTSRVSIRAYLESAGMVKVIVEDNGPGIPAEALPHIFDKFYRAANRSEPGTGLGLSIARGFIEANGGSVTATNRPEGGARFEINLKAGLRESEAAPE